MTLCVCVCVYMFGYVRAGAHVFIWNGYIWYIEYWATLNPAK
jgi:hypothetical protein